MKLKFEKTEKRIALVDENGVVVMAEFWPWTDQQERCYRKLADMMEGRDSESVDILPCVLWPKKKG